MSEMCYFLHDDIDMGAHIYTCGYQKEMIWGECPCKDGISCDFFVSKSEVDKLVRQYVNNRGKEHEIAERKMIYLDDAKQAILDLPNAYNGFSDSYDKSCIIDVLESLPFAQPEDWMERNKERILQAGMEGREIEFRIGGRLFAIREKAQ